MAIKITLGVLGVAAAVGVGFLAIHCKRKKAAPQIEDVVKGLRTYAADFDGLYESLYLASKNKNELSTEAYREWCDRVSQSADDKFKSAFTVLFPREAIQDESRCRKAYSLLLDCLSKADITRTDESKQMCVADENMCRRYLNIDGQKPKVGVSYTVLKAAWISETKVVEYGMLMPTKG